jgi:hypothetical protein
MREEDSKSWREGAASPWFPSLGQSVPPTGYFHAVAGKISLLLYKTSVSIAAYNAQPWCCIS